MKKLISFLTVTAALALASTSNASITNALWYAGANSAVECQTWGWNDASDLLWMHGVNHSTSGNTGGSMVGLIQTDSATDPVLTFSGNLNNDTGSAWLGYQINVIMSVPYTFVTPGPSVANPPVNDWFVASVTGPTLQVSGPYAGQYEGTLLFSDGTPIGVGGEMDFLYSINFSGGFNFSFTQEMIPYFTPIPEPSALVLAGLGSLAVALRLRRNRA